MDCLAGFQLKVRKLGKEVELREDQVLGRSSHPLAVANQRT